ncbi:MAG: cytochrome c maturation protein CcmE [Herpetosiphon sp.]
MEKLSPSIGARRVAGLRPIYWIMVGIVVMAVVFGGRSLKNGAVVSYANVVEAKQSARTVQVFGFLHNQGHYDAKGDWVFDLQGNTGELMTVVYAKAKPANFEEAQSIVATGRYATADGQFHADQLLVKCPSKYQDQAQAAMQNNGR